MIFSPLHNIQTHLFANGLRVYLKEDHASPVISAHAWVRAGSVDEVASQAGIAHVLEHMVFKGTDHHSALQISGWVESMGGAMNAETTKEYTHYYIDIPSPGGERAVLLLGELLHRATFSPDEWRRECPVILEEIKRRNDDPDTLLWELLNRALFEDPSLSRPVIGSPETVNGIAPKDLHFFYNAHYTGSQSIVVIVGDFKPRHVLKWLHKAFDAMPKGTSHPARQSAKNLNALQSLEQRKPLKQAYWAYGFPTPPAIHPDHEALDLVASVLGDGRNSRLVQDLREEKRLVWSVSVGNMTHEGPGVFAIFAESESKNGERLRKRLVHLLKELGDSPPNSAELQRAKNMIQTSWLQGYETYHSQASTLGLFAIDDHLDRLADYLPKLLALTRREVQTVIERYFEPLQLASASIQS